MLELTVSGLLFSLAFGLFCMHDAGNLNDAEFAATLVFMTGIPFGMIMCINEEPDYSLKANGRSVTESLRPFDV
jgi:hypothetical protein